MCFKNSFLDKLVRESLPKNTNIKRKIWMNYSHDTHNVLSVHLFLY